MTNDLESRSGVFYVLWESHDRHPTTTRFTLIGIPLMALIALWVFPRSTSTDPSTTSGSWALPVE
jgi:hypothetical protein